MHVIKKTIESPLQAARSPLLAGGAVILVTFFGFGGWAATAPLASASVATGVVGVTSRRQTLQHLEGGIIAEIPVKDGDLVQAGDLLLRLDDVRSRTNYELMRGQYRSALAEKARLQAERDGTGDVRWPLELVAQQAEPEVRTIMLGQTNVYNSRREFLIGQQRIIRERQEQIKNEIAALQAQERAESTKFDLIGEELKAVEELFKRGLEKRPRLLALQRASAEIEGNRGDLLARAARAHQNISELDAQFIDTKNRIMTETVTQLRDVEAKLSDLEQKLRSTRDSLERIEIRAPRAGYVVNLAYHTIGGVVEPGRAILDIVPTDDGLLVDTRFDPKDSDVLRVGLSAEVTLTPYSRRAVPPLKGKLVMLSADALTDQKTGVPYYAGRVEVDRSELEHLTNVRMVPGMPVQVMIYTGERTALQYFTSPFKESMNRAFREK